MSDLNFFQKYSQRENHLTNNVALMLRLIYRVRPDKLQTIFESILPESTQVKIGPSFQQQLVGSDSIPDAVVNQMGFSVIIEVKPGKHWNKEQINRHLRSVSSQKTGMKILLLLSTDTNPDFGSKLYDIAQANDIILTHTTFENLLNAIDNESVIAPHETDLKEIVSDFREILSSEGMLPNRFHMFAFGCSQTLSWNQDYSMYYDHISRPSKANTLTGFYANKVIHNLGQISAVVTGAPNGELCVEKNESISTEEQLFAKIRSAVSDQRFTADMETPLRFYIYDELHETNFEKSTPYGYFQGVWFNLESYVKAETLAINNGFVESLAKALDGKKFGNSRGW